MCVHRRKRAGSARAYSCSLDAVGYGTVALNHIEYDTVGANSCQINPLQLPAEKAAGKSSIFQSSGAPVPLQQVTRLTAVLEDIAACHALAQGNHIVESYDVVAVQPESQQASRLALMRSPQGFPAVQAFQYACERAWVDVVSFDLSKRIPFFLQPQYVDKAIKRGVMLELAYSAALRDGVARRYFMSNAMALIR